jgi:hypothetical protein
VRRLALLVGLAVVAIGPQASRASCAAPTVNAEPDARRAGQLVLITGESWTTGCDDVGGMCSGCGSCEPPGVVEPEEMESVTIELVGRGIEPVELETLGRDELGSFALELRLPRDLEPGRYRVVARAAPTGERSSARLAIVD